MVGPSRPQFVLFGSSITQFSFSNGGWGAILADVYARKVRVNEFKSCSPPDVVDIVVLSREISYAGLDISGHENSKEADILLRGYLSWNSRRAVQVLDQVFPKDAAVQPSLVIVYFGGNDSMGPHPSGLGPHVPLPEYIDNMRKIATHIQSLSDKTRLIFLTCPPVNETKVRESQSKFLSELVRTNELCKVYAQACIKLCQEIGVKVVDLYTAIQKRDDWMNVCLTDGIHLSAEGSKVVVEEIMKVLKEAEWKPSLFWKSLPTEFAEDSPYDLIAADGTKTLNGSDWIIHRDIMWD